ncbi:hypothetical protein ACGF0J_14035 [Nonomuraea sp. NPDC047897]|uniref:hypothetical protein n=1 Tax=Nonomuraea sp. NPDC047897 TaxID=3364346 RepID=UPI0037138950
MLVTREQAELARDFAANATRSARNHMEQCRRCTQEVPCELGGMLRRGALKIQREARDALTAYLPAGSQVTYHGNREQYQGRVWTVVGPSRKEPWSGYTLTARGVPPIAASLASLRLTSREAQERDLLAQARHACKTVLAVMPQHGVHVDVTVDRADSGRVLVAWSPVEYLAAERRVTGHENQEVKAYLSAALYLLQVLRATCAASRWHDIRTLADRARKLAAHAGVRV